MDVTRYSTIHGRCVIERIRLVVTITREVRSVILEAGGTLVERTPEEVHSAVHLVGFCA